MPVIPLINPKRMKKSSRKSVCGWQRKMSDAHRKAKAKKQKNPFMLKPKAPAKKWYVGRPINSRSFVMFQSEINPTQATHGHVYSYAIGPFSTKLGATIMTRHGYNNPHIQTVSQAEALARRGTSWLLSQGFHV